MSWVGTVSGIAPGASAPQMKSASERYSTTNVQVAGVDEADLVKTDGTYIYTVASGKLIIVKAIPADAASILSTTSFSGMTPKELFLDGDRLLVFGTTYGGIRPLAEGGVVYDEKYGPIRSTTTTIVELYDIRDRASPKRLKTFEVEGDYLTSRQIGHDAYFVVNSYPRIYAYPVGTNATEIIPLAKDPSGTIEPIAKPTDIGFIPGILPTSFITVAGISMADENRAMSKETIAGFGPERLCFPEQHVHRRIVLPVLILQQGRRQRRSREHDYPEVRPQGRPHRQRRYGQRQGAYPEPVLHGRAQWLLPHCHDRRRSLEYGHSG